MSVCLSVVGMYVCMYVCTYVRMHVYTITYTNMTVQLPRSMGWTLTAAVKLALVSKDLRRVLAIVVLNRFNASFQPGFLQDSPIELCL